jgi:phospholipid-translocating ATPase
VTPTEDDNKVRTFQASSPDEIALVQISERVGLRLQLRDLHKIVILTPAKVEEVYEILYEFPFSSERKRMGIILRAPDHKGVFFYLKGADTVMKSKVPEVQRGFLMDECETLSREGLRTLVITQKFIPD